MCEQPTVTQPARPQSMRPFLVIWSGQAFSLLGSQLVHFALVWWLTETSGSATTLAFGTMMGVLPMILLGPFAGALVDRWNRRGVMLVADAGIALATVVLAVLYMVEIAQVWQVYALMLIRATGGVFHSTAMRASTTLLVPEERLSRVAGLNQTLFGLINIAAPPLGALLLDLIPMQGLLAIDVGTAMLAITPLLFLPIPQPARREALGKTGEQPSFALSVLTDMREGWHFVWAWPGLLVVLAMALLVNLLWGPAYSLLPLIVTKHFRGGALELAWLESAVGIGLVLGGVTLSVWGGFKRRILTWLLAAVLAGVGVTVVGLAPSTAFLLAAGGMFIVGFWSPIANGSMEAILQATVPPEMQGRVLALSTSAALAVAPLGLAIAGPVADALGEQIWFLICGITQVGVCVGAFFIPALMQIECTTYSPIMSVSGYTSSLSSAGFAATVFGGYDERPEDGSGKTICFLCWKDREGA